MVQAIRDFSPPQNCGVYKMIGEKNRVLYIGKAKNLRSRLFSYCNLENLSERIKVMLSKVVKIEIFITENEIEAFLLEAQLIKSLSPTYNILLKDGKSYPYIVISKHDYPRIAKYRGRLKGDKFYYYGPFPSATAVNSTIKSLQALFSLRGCKDEIFHTVKKPCFQYQLSLCSAPCVNKITKENYGALVKQAKNTLLGKNREVEKKLHFLMQRYSREERYDLAALYKERLEFLKQIQTKVTDFYCTKDADFLNIAREGNSACIHVLSFRDQCNYGSIPYFIENCEGHSDDEIFSTFLADLYNKVDYPMQIYVPTCISQIDIIEQALCKTAQKSIKVLYANTGKERDLLKSIYNNSLHSLKQKLIQCKSNLDKLEGIAKIFSLKYTPNRIEIYDNSHISGGQQVGVMVVAGKDGFLKNEYRKFTVPSGGNDYKMMKEMLIKRFSGSIKDVMPDFLLIDGGPGHVSLVDSIFRTFQVNIPFACIAKRDEESERFYMPNREEFTLPSDNSGMLYLQLLRNEAHRFAITSHRKKRSKTFLVSQLDKIPGIGQKRKRELMLNFGSIENIKKASLTEIQKVLGVDKQLAETVHCFLKNDSSII
ncbi:MAG: excinuclease ABC subunit UvrC [Wolbachia endosymbiont of Fragariocoptes setiger]|nr:excinuclease ABC subunit UvrC [Wolbachia endosymbiont of Fragariocoptes setiger]